MKNNFKFTLVFLLITCSSISIFSQEGNILPNLQRMNFNVYFSSSYSYNTNKPSNHSNQLRVFDFDDNSFKFDVIGMVLQKKVDDNSRSGFRVDFTTGASQPRITAASGLFRDETSGKSGDFDLLQAHITYLFNVGKGLKVDFGKFLTHMGYELVDGLDGFNDNATRSLLFGYAIPFSHVGLRASYKFNDMFSSLFQVTNGQDNAKDLNSSKTFGFQIGVTPSESFSSYVNFISGNESIVNTQGNRTIFDLCLSYKLNPMNSFGFNYDYGMEKDAFNTGTDAKWNGAALYFKHTFSDIISLAVRLEQFNDQNGFRTGAIQKVNGVTFTPSFQLTNNLVFRVDVRYDNSDQEVFTTSTGTSKKQTTFYFNLFYVD